MGQFVESANICAEHPVGLQLRAMDIIYETTKERGATILMATSRVDSLNPSSALLAVALAAKGLPEVPPEPQLRVNAPRPESARPGADPAPSSPGASIGWVKWRSLTKAPET